MDKRGEQGACRLAQARKPGTRHAKGIADADQHRLGARGGVGRDPDRHPVGGEKGGRRVDCVLPQGEARKLASRHPRRAERVAHRIGETVAAIHAQHRLGLFGQGQGAAFVAQEHHGLARQNDALGIPRFRSGGFRSIEAIIGITEQTELRLGKQDAAHRIV